jgi:5,6,7,8-tetrahydromethanopterin hydro-lyase
MSERIVLRTGEALVRGRTKPTAAEPEIVIGELDGPLGNAFANLIGDQVKGHTRVFAILNGDVQVRPATIMVSKVTVNKTKYTNILMGTVQAAVANGVLDAVRDGTIPKDKANELGIIAAIWLTPAAADDKNLDHEDLFETHRKAMYLAIRKAMNNEPSIDWLLENQEKIVHSYHQRGLNGEL